MLERHSKPSKIWEQFVREYPDVEGFQSDLASYYQYLGDLNVFLEHRDEALKLFQKACRTWEQLLARHPERSGVQNDPDWRTTWNTLARSPRCRKEKVAAFQRVLSLREALVAEFPGVAEYCAGLANGLRRSGEHLWTQDPQRNPK